jgi:hypothetical protein
MLYSRSDLGVRGWKKDSLLDIHGISLLDVPRISAKQFCHAFLPLSFKRKKVLINSELYFFYQTRSIWVLNKASKSKKMFVFMFEFVFYFIFYLKNIKLKFLLNVF